MKKSLIKLFIILIFFGCKKKNEIEKPISEDWQLVSEESIQYGYRDIRATEVIGDELLIISRNNLYFFDTFLIKMKDKNYLYTNNLSTNLNLSVKHNSNYFLFLKEFDKSRIDIIDSKQPIDQISFEFTLSEINTTFDEEFGYSSINNSNEFDLVYRTYSNNTVTYNYNTIFIDHIPNKFTPIAIKSKNKKTLLSYQVSVNSYPKITPRVYKFNNLSFVSIGGIIYRLQNGELLDTSRYTFNNMFEYKGLLYAQQPFSQYVADNLERQDGLLESKDQGKTWKYVGYGRDLGNQNIKNICGKLVLYKNRNIAIIDLDNMKIIEKDLTNLNAAIQSIEKVGNKIIVGTDAGVYYKSWEAFLNK
jgi:hypothetical protein